MSEKRERDRERERERERELMKVCGRDTNTAFSFILYSKFHGAIITDEIFITGNAYL